jgi:ADP-ribose pyrophosphatase YjhB (NUDIX family)
VGGIAFDERGRVLLVERGQAPSRGRWTIPGGRVESGETLEEACRRELFEETGLHVIVGDKVLTITRRGPGYHYLIHDFLVTITGGELSAGSDAANVAFLTLDEVRERPHTDGLLPALEKAKEALSRSR